jgi:hypothetical protein
LPNKKGSIAEVDRRFGEKPMTLTELLQKLEKDRFYGTVQFIYKAGRVELARQEETIKLEGTEPHDNINNRIR